MALRETLADAPDLLAWALANGVRLRFIEQMPLDADQTWRRDHLVSAEEFLSVLGRRYRLTPAGREDPSAPAEEWLVDGGPATVGIIGSVTRSFCDACDRTRLTAEGSVRSCLFGDDETDLRTMLRSGADDAAIADAWRATMWDKPGWARDGRRRAFVDRPVPWERSEADDVTHTRPILRSRR